VIDGLRKGESYQSDYRTLEAPGYATKDGKLLLMKTRYHLIELQGGGFVWSCSQV
jgi:hypothetical protein